MTRLLVIMALWQRPRVAHFVLDRLAAQRQRLARATEHPSPHVRQLLLEVLTVGSEGDVSAELAAAHGARYIEHANQPLGAKWNAALAAAREYDPDAVMVLGSDNMVNDALLRKWGDEISDGVDYLGVIDNHMYQPSTDTLLYWKGYPKRLNQICRQGETIGSARCYSRALLDQVDWVLWDGALASSLDYSVTCRLRELDIRARCHRMGDIQHLGIKTAIGLTPMERFVANSGPQIRDVPVESLVDWYGDDTVTQLRALGDDDDDTSTVDAVTIPG